MTSAEAKAQLESVSCHCDGSSDGHPVGAAGCAERVRLGVYAREQVGGVAAGGRCGPAKGTCRSCGRPGVKVLRREVRGFRQGRDITGVPLGVLIELVAHKTPGRGGVPCAAAGRAPAEMRFRPSWLIADWRQKYGDEAVVVQ